jgi:hypothetical protein
MQEFLNRYQQGPPTERYTTQEAAQQFSQMAPQLSPNQFQQAATQSFANLSPEQRMQFGQLLMQQAQQQGYGVPALPPSSYQDPNALAQLTTQVHQQNPGLLGSLLGGGQGGGGGQTWETLDPQTRDLFIRQWGADRAQAEWEKENAQAHSPLHNPIAKAAVGGIAAMAFKSLLSQ